MNSAPLSCPHRARFLLLSCRGHPLAGCAARCASNMVVVVSVTQRQGHPSATPSWPAPRLPGGISNGVQVGVGWPGPPGPGKMGGGRCGLGGVVPGPRSVGCEFFPKWLQHCSIRRDGGPPLVSWPGARVCLPDPNSKPNVPLRVHSARALSRHRVGSIPTGGGGGGGPHTGMVQPTSSLFTALNLFPSSTSSIPVQPPDGWKWMKFIFLGLGARQLC